MRVLHIMSGFGGGISSFIINKAKYFNNKEITFIIASTATSKSTIFHNTFADIMPPMNKITKVTTFNIKMHLLCPLPNKNCKAASP